MVSLFGFRTRSPERDREKDDERLLRMREFLEGMAAEIEAERAGLEKRYRSQVADAGFLAEALENSEASAGSSAREQELSSSIMRCEKRLAELARQNGEIGRLMQSLDRFSGSAMDEEAGLALPGGPR